jgi:hypothetical protein
MSLANRSSSVIDLMEHPVVLSRESRPISTLLDKCSAAGTESDLTLRVPCAKRALGRGHSRVVSRNVELHIAENGIVSIAVGASISMLLLFVVALRSSLLWEDGFSRAGFFPQRYWNETVSSGLLAAAHASLICFEELLSKSAPLISFCFPAYVPLIFALHFACSNLTSRIRS